MVHGVVIPVGQRPSGGRNNSCALCNGAPIDVPWYQTAGANYCGSCVDQLAGLLGLLTSSRARQMFEKTLAELKRAKEAEAELTERLAETSTKLEQERQAHAATITERDELADQVAQGVSLSDFIAREGLADAAPAPTAKRKAVAA